MIVKTDVNQAFTRPIKMVGNLRNALLGKIGIRKLEKDE
jgi:hypothetical protein